MTRRLTAVAGLTTALVVVVPGAAAAAALHPHSARHNLPADGPRALYKAEPRLPTAAGWPGPNNAFPQTSGTGRLAGGGMFWTDYLYDDHGTTTDSTGGISVTAGSPSFGTYTYPDGKASQNGADIFRAAVLRRHHATYWRVDWNTLASAKVPIAEWTLDRDHSAATGVSTWPANAGASSPGIDTALVMSGRRAQLINLTTDKARTFPVTVDRAAHSFVARIPNHVLKPHGSWRIRLAAGLANPSGTAFVPAADALPSQTAIYNVTFRRRTQEKPGDDFWNDEKQTTDLRTGNVAPFSTLIRWRALAHRMRTPQKLLHGWSDQWYVSDVSLGPGIITDPSSIEDNEANYLGRVQPYGVYVPNSYHGKHRVPLTFLLHSLTQNHNQYAATTPHFTKQACEDRHSICATTLGRGPDGFYYGPAQLDFWQVWHQLASTYRLNPNRTVLSGYSMGGIGTNEIAMAHPDLFARAVTLAGAVGDRASLRNLRWVPTYLAGGVSDELVPVTTERAEALALEALGNRYRWVLYPGVDHVAYELADSFADAAKYMGRAHRARNPGRFTYTWVPHDETQAFPAKSTGLAGFRWTQQPKLRVTNTGDYWLRRLNARHDKADSAALRAFSGERPMPKVKAHASHNVPTTSGPGPGLVSTQTWSRGKRAHRTPVIRLHLRNVTSLRVLMHAAGFHHGQSGKLKVTSDGRSTIRLGHRTVHVAKGRHVVPFRA
jgi:hypothetical protein